MSRIVIILLSLLCVSTGLAQDRIKQIRELYASALAGVKDARENQQSQTAMLTQTIRRNEPAMGLVTYENELYTNTNEQQCAFYRSKRTAGPYDPTVTEALFDENGQIIFCYIRETFVYDTTTWRYEERFYWNADGTLCKLLRKGTWADGKERQLTAEDFTNDADAVKQSCEEFYRTHAPEL